MQHGRVEIVDRGDILDRLVTELVRRTMAVGAFDTGAGQPDRESGRIVVTTTGALLKRRHAAKFRAPDDQRLLQEAALFQIDQ